MLLALLAWVDRDEHEVETGGAGGMRGFFGSFSLFFRDFFFFFFAGAVVGVRRDRGDSFE